MNRLTFYNREYLKSNRPFCTDFSCQDSNKWKLFVRVIKTSTQVGEIQNTLYMLQKIKI